MDIDYPYRFDGRGQTAETNEPNHLRHLIEQVVFTAPGERVNRPDFGCGLRQLVFEPNSEALAGATQMLIQGALQQWLGDRIEVRAVEVSVEDAILRIGIHYVPLRTREPQAVSFERAVR